MKAHWLTVVVVSCSLIVTGCKDSPTANPKSSGNPSQQAGNPSAENQEKEAKIKASLAKLSPEDQRLAEEQKFCAVENDNRLGKMGMPVKIMVKGQPVFLCCDGCTKEAEDDPDATLAKVKELKEKNKTPTK
jgi:hypothetical protein